MYKDIHFGAVLLIMNGSKAYYIIDRWDDLSAKIDNITNKKNWFINTNNVTDDDSSWLQGQPKHNIRKCKCVAHHCCVMLC